MTHRRLQSLVLALPLLVAGCNVALVRFDVPPQVQSGAVFQIRVDANISGSSGEAGCVLQLPLGFTVLSATYVYLPGGLGTSTGPDAGLTALYRAEPGHHLASFWGGGSATNAVGMQVFVGAPAGASGTHTFKIALAGGARTSWVAQDPPQTNFAAITGSQYVRTLTVVPQSLGDFAYDMGALPASVMWRCSGVAAGDVDGDGFADLAAESASLSCPASRCWLSRPHSMPTLGGTAWTERSSGLSSVYDWPRIAMADIDGDGFLDIVSGNGLVFFGNGGSSWLATQIPSIQTNIVAIGDIDRNGLLDIALSKRYSKSYHVFLNNGNRTFRAASQGLPPFSFLSGGDSLLLVDLNGDGFLDLFSTAIGDNVWLGNGGLSWTQATAPVAGRGLGSCAMAIDLDGDGVVEVISSGNAGISAFHSVGGANFASVSLAGLPATGAYRGMAALDYDRDGLMDFAFGRGWQGTEGGIELYRNLGNSTYSLQSGSGFTDAFYGDVNDLVVGDFNGDTWPDIAAAVDGVGVLIFQNMRTGVAPFGTGCSGSGVAIPQLTALGAPQRGNSSFAMQLHSSVPSVWGAFWYDFQRQVAPPLPLPVDLGSYGAPLCTLYTNPQVVHLGALDASGNATFPLPVPLTPSLTHLTAFGQGAVFVPGANALGAVVTSAQALRID